MRAYGLAEVVESTASNLAKGTIVQANTNWNEYVVLPARACRPVEQMPGLDVSHFLGALGGTGLTAYYGLVDVVRATGADSVVVSGAAGATGSMVVQIAKRLLGCKKVIGIAGSEEKCRWVESLGADVCINYKKDSFKDELTKATEGFVDIYYDNVGGEILDFMLTRVKRHGRIAACGSVATYNEGAGNGLKNWSEIVMNRLEVRGFIITDAVQAGKAPKMIGELVKGLKEGKIKVGEENQTVVETKFEDIPKTWTGLFEGRNQGKLITKLI
jgi:NADPH-dependent curcumin reductase CurA